MSEENYVIYAGEKISVGRAIYTYEHPEGMECTRVKTLNAKREIKRFVVHWDACLSSKSCYEVLENRGLSVHLSIDNDGRIWQFADLNSIGYHAKGDNQKSVGVEISNAVELKYQKEYIKNGFGPRPLIPKSPVHEGTYPPHLGFYPAQTEALKDLIKILRDVIGLELAVPLDLEGKLITKALSPSTLEQFRGVICHYHINPQKVDCAGLELDKIIEEVKNG